MDEAFDKLRCFDQPVHDFLSGNIWSGKPYGPCRGNDPVLDPDRNYGNLFAVGLAAGRNV